MKGYVYWMREEGSETEIITSEGKYRVPGNVARCWAGRDYDYLLASHEKERAFSFREADDLDWCKHGRFVPDRQCAAYRTLLKRILRAAIGAGSVDNDAATSWLESELKQVAVAAPAVVARGLTRAFDTAARQWTRGNNSGDPRTLEECEKQCEATRGNASRVLKIWGVRVDYPGLYPCFLWDGITHYDAESLMRDIAKKAT
jgi:hypothetical protein